MKYVTVVDGKIEVVDSYKPQDKYAIVFKYNDKQDVHIFNNSPVIASGDNIIIGEKTIPLKDVSVVPIDEHFEEVLDIIRSHGSNDISTRDILDRLPDPRAVKMHTFTSVVCFAILANGRSVPLSKKDRTRKASLIRNVKKQIEKDTEISISLGFELLTLFGINPEEIFNNNYIVK